MVEPMVLQAESKNLRLTMKHGLLENLPFSWMSFQAIKKLKPHKTSVLVAFVP
jgi:hypothetical protein